MPQKKCGKNAAARSGPGAGTAAYASRHSHESVRLTTYAAVHTKHISRKTTNEMYLPRMRLSPEGRQAHRPQLR